MGNKEIFDMLRQYAETHILVEGYSVIKYDVESGIYYLADDFNEENLFPLTSSNFELIPDAFYDLDVDVKEEGFYTFTALLEMIGPNDCYGPHQYSIAHIEWTLVLNIEEHNRQLNEAEAWLFNNENDLLF